MTKLEGANQRIINLKAGNSQKESRKLVEREKLGKAITSMNTAVGKGSLMTCFILR